MIQGKVLVTGATGDTGGATVEELLCRGHRVRALAHRQDERSKQLQERGVEVVFGDLLDFVADAHRAEGCATGLLLLPHSTGHRPGDGPVCPGREGGRRRRHREHVADLGAGGREEPCRDRSLAGRTRLRLVRLDRRPHPADVLRRVAAVPGPDDPRRAAPRAVRDRPPRADRRRGPGAGDRRASSKIPRRIAARSIRCTAPSSSRIRTSRRS